MDMDYIPADQAALQLDVDVSIIRESVRAQNWPTENRKGELYIKAGFRLDTETDPHDDPSPITRRSSEWGPIGGSLLDQRASETSAK
jgi:hypothetical protein